jgi:uncharacterized protein YebE (UPF0316 family)
LWLFIIYGIIFEALTIKYLSSVKNYKRVSASTISVTLFLLNLLGLNEVLNSNIYYAVPIAFGSWAGVFIQMTIEKRKDDKNEAGGHRTSGGEDSET